MSRTDPQINIRMPKDLLERVAGEANANKRSMTAEIVARLEVSDETLRDRFAMAALPAIIGATSAGQHYPGPAGNAPLSTIERMAFDAYAVADAMLAERSKP